MVSKVSKVSKVSEVSKVSISIVGITNRRAAGAVTAAAAQAQYQQQQPGLTNNAITIRPSPTAHRRSPLVSLGHPHGKRLHGIVGMQISVG